MTALQVLHFAFPCKICGGSLVGKNMCDYTVVCKALLYTPDVAKYPNNGKSTSHPLLQRHTISTF